MFLDHSIKRMEPDGYIYIDDRFNWIPQFSMPVWHLEGLLDKLSFDYITESGVLDTFQAYSDLYEVANITYILVMANKHGNNREKFLYYLAHSETLINEFLMLQYLILKSYLLTGAPLSMYNDQDYKVPAVIKNFLAGSYIHRSNWDLPNYQELTKLRGIEY